MKKQVFSWKSGRALITIGGGRSMCSPLHLHLLKRGKKRSPFSWSLDREDSLQSIPFLVSVVTISYSAIQELARSTYVKRKGSPRFCISHHPLFSSQKQWPFPHGCAPNSPPCSYVDQMEEREVKVAQKSKLLQRPGDAKQKYRIDNDNLYTRRSNKKYYTHISISFNQHNSLAVHLASQSIQGEKRATRNPERKK